MKAHHLYSTATTLAAAALLAAPSLADQTISDTQTKAVNMTEGKLTVTGTGFLNVAKNAVNLKDPIRSALEIEVMEGGGISGKSALALDQDMENGVTGQLITLTNSGTIIAKDSFGSADGLAIGGGIVTNTGTITASNSNTNGQAYGILVDDSDGGNAFEAIRITNSGTIEGTGANGVGIRIVSGKENCIFMEGGTITGGSGHAVIMGSGDDMFSYSGGTVNGSVDGGAGFNTMVFQPMETDLTFSSDLKNFHSISIQGSPLSPGASVTLENLTITLDMASLSQDKPLFSLEGNSTASGSLLFNNAILQLMGAPDALPVDGSGMVYFKLAGDGISLEGLEIRTEGGYELDMSRDGYVGVNFNTPEPVAAALGLLGFFLSMLRRRRTAA
ncbi:hypothetical protein [Akkermansia sp.]|uniref:hypothetical protein n=1 Tax=Akkermansia sp. TaxID=1872421 RepID=UPI0025C11E74|nr:hypothetical protein [Akkermansia sp.]MCD8063524.1 hypothetical protein [Akkermansia sp.]